MLTAFTYKATPIAPAYNTLQADVIEMILLFIFLL